MNTINIPMAKLIEANWNSNIQDEAMMARLRESLRTFGLVENLVVRSVGNDYEVLSGNHRLAVLKEMGVTTVPCVIVESDDHKARLLSQALNRIHGEDDLGLRSELIKKTLERFSATEIASILPDTAASLVSLANMGKEKVSDYLIKWERARSVRLKHFIAQLTAEQLEVVEQALATIDPDPAQRINNPNVRGTKLYLLCQKYLEVVQND
ncbi:MAG: ParB N-terminal domain-containing protein [Dehalogenimonas sp.]